MHPSRVQRAIQSLEPEQARFRLFDSITTFLKDAAQSQPLMLVLEDLHWANRSSLLLLEFLAQEIEFSPFLVVGTYRDVEVFRRHPLSETLGSLIREPQTLRVQLSGLVEMEVEQLIQEAWTDCPSPELALVIHQRTGGNPLFVSQIAAMLGTYRLQDRRQHLNDIPVGVRNAIGRRLNRLSEGCNQVLSTASVVGREFDLKLLGSLDGGGVNGRLLEALEVALAAGVIEDQPGTPGRYQVTHALIQETLLSELSSTRRAGLHAKIGQALEALHGPGTRTYASELAHHFAGAQLVLGPAKLVGYSLLAGDRALASYAYHDAIGHFERGLVARTIA